MTAVERQVQFNGAQIGRTIIGMRTIFCVIIGGLLGYQIGNGKTLATVVGMAGGACSGNTTEKNMKKITVYEVRLRIDDNAVRKLDVSTAVPEGSKVIVEGKTCALD